MKGAGGTSGGLSQFFMGIVMMCGGFYMLLNSIVITSSWGMGARLYNFGGGYALTSGMIMIPFLFGVGIIFYNSRNPIGWLLTVGSLTGLIFGVISSIHFSFRSMSAFDLIVILVLAFGGVGFFLRSLKDYSQGQSST